MKILTKIALILVLAAFSCTASFAQLLPSKNPQADSLAFAKVRARMDSIRQYRPTVALVLAGGGALGLAHLGVIRYMEELGIPVDMVTGTSMGGLVGGLYALGYRHKELDSLVRSINWPLMMSDDIPQKYQSFPLREYRDRFLVRIPWKYDDEDLANRFRRERLAETMAEEAQHGTADILRESIDRMGIGMPDGYLFGLNVRKLLSSVSVGYQDSLSFADLPIPYACVATDLYSMTPKYWTSGSILSALRSTMAIPLYFRAVREDGAILLDGAMRNNFPVDLAREMGADIVIGSEMAEERELNELNSPVDFMMQIISLLSSSTIGPAKEMLDMDVHHELKGYNMLSFDEKSVDDIINQGYQNALLHKETFESVAALTAGRSVPSVSYPVKATNLARTKVRVKDVRFTGVDEKDWNKILHKNDYNKEGIYDRDEVERMLNRIYGTSVFESVTYHLEGASEPYTLVFDCQKGQVNDFAVSLRADTDEYVAAIVHLGLGTRRLGGPRLAVDMKLGTNPFLSLDAFYKSDIGLPTVGLTLRNKFLNVMYGTINSASDKLFSMAADLYLSDSRLNFGSFKAGLTAEMDPYEHYLSYDEEWKGYDWRSYWLSAFASFKMDTLDDGYFPTSGVRVSLGGRYVFKGYTIDLDPNEFHPEGALVTPGGSVPRYFSGLAGLEGAFTIGKRFTIHPKLYFGWYSYNSYYLNPRHVVTVGGFMPGRFTEFQIPFFGIPAGYRECSPFSSMGQLDLRYRLGRKNFITARGGIFFNSVSFPSLFTTDPSWAAGAEFARQTIVGPLKLALQWCTDTGFTAYAAIGFDF